MALSYTCLILQRMVLPFVLVLAALFRPVGISFVFLLMFFISPFIPIATAHNFKGSVTAYLIILIALSTLLLLCHVALQVVIISLHIEQVFGTCSFTEQLLRHIGFIDFFNISPWDVVKWLLPELVVFITSIAIYIVIKKISLGSNRAETDNAETASIEAGPATRPKPVVKKEHAVAFEPLIAIAPLFCLATLFFAAVLRPSIPGGVYFLCFLIFGSYWATFNALKRGFAIFIRFVVAMIVLHIIAVVSYQTPWVQEILDEKSLVARLIGLEALALSSCEKDIRIIEHNSSYKFDSYLNPISLLCAYYTLVLTTKNLIKRRSVSKPLSAYGQLENGTKINRQISLNTRTTNTSKKDSWSKTQRLNTTLQPNAKSAEPTETTPLVRQRKPIPEIGPSGRIQIELHNSESAPTDIPLNVMGSAVDKDKEPSLFDQICYGIISTSGFIYQNSYIFTNILMMAWSIIFHSWLTFVFLLWANVLWMIPNQRKAMMRSSFFIVIYAELLLIAQYLYGLNLNNDELPSHLNSTGINLQQIGLDRPQDHNVQPCIPLTVKTLFLLMFWVTLRQFFKENWENRRHSAIADMLAPLQVSMSTATADVGAAEHRKTSKFLKKTGDVIKNLLVRLWIWLLILVIFVCSISGTKMTGFRICYMAMFLFFLLVFQVSSSIWVKFMYGYWLFLIFYAMTILTLIYTYQFDKFDEYWHEYLDISKTLQEDIGLKKYETKDLFLHLFSPTVMVILTVIQVHYFHARFIAALQKPITTQPRIRVHKKGNYEPEVILERASMGRESLGKLRMGDYAVSMEEGIQASVKDLIRRLFTEFKAQSKLIAKNFKNVFWKFLELHLMKAVYISAFVCCVSETCILHIVLCILCTVGVVSKTQVQIFISRIISLVVSIIVLTKMIYQVQYITHESYNVHCNETIIGNNAIWFGLQKTTVDGGLMDVIKKYIIFMVMLTLHAVVTLRQKQMRLMIGEPVSVRPKVLFPRIRRIDAEKNLEGLLKYLFNYGYYRFGIECTLIALVSLITFRQDMVAILYVFWLCLLTWMSRRGCARIWGVFQCFTAIIICLQFFLLVGLPPGLCLTYPWEDTEYSDALQLWAMLPGPLHHNHTNKLIFDFILLMFINRQKRVFVIERLVSQDDSHMDRYPGGTNKSVIQDIENLGIIPFKNPTRDFLSTIRNYLDIVKNAVFCGFYWVTLAIVFLAGTHISDLLAIGYLIGSFVFLWQGTDFFLRPIRTILRKWNYLLVYNISVISLKTVLQIGGCLYMDYLRQNVCWLVHMLGITCVAETESGMVDFDENASDCPPLKSYSILVWDAVCFSFIIFQLRIFGSHYFCHVINDAKANTLLASRGAEIIEDFRLKQIAHRKRHEQEVLRKIKRKMEKIRATQKKMRPIDRVIHYDEHGVPIAGVRITRRKEPRLHAAAVRAGDYYMFDDMDEKFELDLIEDEVDFLEEEGKIDESEKKMTRRKNLFEICKEITGGRKKTFSRQRSYASAPGSRIGIKNMEPDIPRASVISDPLVYPDSRANEETEDKTRNDRHKSDSDKDAPPKKDEKTEEPGEDSDNSEESGDLEEESYDEIEPPNPILRLLEGFMVSFVIRLNRLSRNYRYVMKILAEEKRNLRLTKAYNQYGSTTTLSIPPPSGHRGVNIDSTFSDDEASNTNAQSSQSNTETHDTDTDTIVPVLHRPLVNIDEIKLDTTDGSPRKESDSPRPTRQKTSGVPGIRVMAPSVERGLDETGTLSEEWSYERSARTGSFTHEGDFVSRDHHIIVEAIISCWYAVLANTDILCYIVVFINQVVNASLISLPLPLMVFMWGTLSLPRPTKTFWITLIAYTQAIVLIKTIFQFKLIWSNYINLPNQPLDPAKIIGIELNRQYAKYDLLLLLVLYFHRFVLKSQGLWKSQYKSVLLSKRSVSIAGDSQKNVASSTEVDVNQIMVVPESPSVNEQASVGDEHNIYVKRMSKLKDSKYTSSCRKFFFNLVHKVRLPADVYALMFLCDFINFFVLLFGFTAFGSQHGEGGVQTYLVENKVPIPFLIMLLVQFILIVIDRALYLRKALVYKIIFHYFSVIGIHVWMFFVIPAVTERSFYSLTPPIIFYLIKCFYLLFSSYQIKCGYPKRILGNFLTKGFSLVNMVFFKVYMQIPFLFELRTVLDWVCTDTTMTLFDWLKMEDVFSAIYFIKCIRQMELDFPAIRGQKKDMLVKISLGGTAILLIVIAIWGPLCLFALGGAVGQPNVPYEVSATIRIGPYEPIYDMNNRESVHKFKGGMLGYFHHAYRKNRHAITFLSSYDSVDIAAIVFKYNSPSLWKISPPDKDRLLKDLKEGETLSFRFAFTIIRIPPTKGAIGSVSHEIQYELDENFKDKETLIQMLEGRLKSTANVTIPHIMPKFIKVQNTGELHPIIHFLPVDEPYRPLIIKLHNEKDITEGIWWEIHEQTEDAFYKNTLASLPHADEGFVMYTFNDKKFPSTFSFLTAGGIIGLYTTFVLLASRLLKSFIAGQSKRIMYEDLPYVDRILQLCLDIYLVREALEFALEEDLFSKLVFLYRSPETMIKWTRPKEEIVEDETDTESIRSRGSHPRVE